MTCKTAPADRPGQNLCFTSVLFPGGHAAPDVALLFIHIQHLSHLLIEAAIALGQALLKILMYRGFGYAEVGCGGTDGGTGLDHVHSQLAYTLLDGV